ncbi:MAG: hypothetical protein GXO62_08275 [Epsilonproteobacteria bacterium]|nr:hypothetical protein [Campylobacterota bacterium]
MELVIHPKTKKVTIEIPHNWVDKDLQIQINPKITLEELGGSIKIPKEKVNYELEEKAWEKAVFEKYNKRILND